MREKFVYVEGESDKIFLTILNEVKNLGTLKILILSIVGARISFLKKPRVLKET